MKEKITDICVVTCVSLGGISLAMLYRAGPFTCILLLVLSVIVTLAYSLALKKERVLSKPFKTVIASLALVSSAVSVTVASTLVTTARVMPAGTYPLILLLTGLLAICFAVSKLSACKNTATTAVIISVLILALLLFLCLITSELTPVPVSDGVNFRLLFLLASFSIGDIAFILPLLARDGKTRLVMSGALSAAFLLTLSLVAVSLLSIPLFYELDFPLLTLFRTTFITSFLSRYEIVAVIAFYTLSAVKAGLILKCSVDNLNKSVLWLVIPLAAAVILISVFRPLIYAAAAMSALVGIIMPVYILARKEKTGEQN